MSGALDHCLAARWRSLPRSPAQQAVAVEWEAHHGGMHHDLHCRIDEYQLCLPQLWHTDGHRHQRLAESRACAWHSGAISFLTQTIILGIFGHGYCEYVLVRKSHKVYTTVRVFLAVSLNWRVALYELLHSVPVHLLSVCMRVFAPKEDILSIFFDSRARIW